MLTERSAEGAASLALPVGRYRLRFETNGRHYNQYQGSAWRGAFGHALKRMVCVTRLPECGGCILHQSCVYPYIFESPLPSGSQKMRRYERVPHPFIISLPPTPVEPDHNGNLLGLTLFGAANRHLPYVIHALRQAGDNGIGRRRERNSLTVVEQTTGLDDGWREIYRPDGALASSAPAALLYPNPNPLLA